MAIADVVVMVFFGRLHSSCLLSGASALTLTEPSPSLHSEVSPPYMAVSLQNQALATRPCVFCGKSMFAHLARCPHCREDVPKVQLSSRPRTGGRQQIRRALLYMLLAGVIQYFAGGYSGFTVPVTVSPIITTYLAPVVFLSALGLLVYGFYLRAKS
jgi:hypothetical protein